MWLPSENQWLSKNKSLSWIRAMILRKFSKEHWFVLKRTSTLFCCLSMRDYSISIIKSKQVGQPSRHFSLTIPRGKGHYSCFLFLAKDYWTNLYFLNFHCLELTFGVSIWIWKWNMELLIQHETYSTESSRCNSSLDKWSSSSGNSYNSKLPEDHLKVSKLLNRKQLNL